MKHYFYLYLLLSITLFVFACKTNNTKKGHNSTATHDTKKTPSHKGEREFEEYLEMKRDKFVGQKAPNETITTLSGKKINLSESNGKVILLNFWFAACKPCITEIPSLKELHTQYQKKGLILLSVSTDDEKKAKQIVDEQKIKYAVAAQGKKLAEKLQVTSYPTSFLIDENGTIIEVFIGASSFDATQTYYEVKPHLEKIFNK